MHDALLIPEVLGTILRYLAENTRFSDEDVKDRDRDRDDGSGRHALTALARTCRALSDPALDVLWSKLDSLEPLILCVPEKAWNYYDHIMDQPSPAIDEEQWGVVLRYAPRVHELVLEDDESNKFSMKILQSLSTRTTLLLPNLRKLRWVYPCYDPSTLSLIRLLIGPSLVHLHMWLEAGHHVSALLDHYHKACSSNLESLHLRHRSYPPSPEHAARKALIDRSGGCRPPEVALISRAIRRSPNVEILSCDSIDEEGLIRIVQSRCLTKLCCNASHQNSDTLIAIAGRGTPFKNVRVLDLRVKDLSSIIPFLKSQNQPFEEVSFSIFAASTPEVLHEFFVALNSATRCRTLRRIRLLPFSPPGYRDSSDHAVDVQVLSPLMTFNLRELAINIKNPFSWDDDELLGLVQAWPELQILHLSDFSNWNYPFSARLPTLRGLVLLLARCPKLRELGLCLSATNIPSLSEDESLIRNTAITRFLVSPNSPIGVEMPRASVARFLMEHLPSLRDVSHPDDDSGNLGGRRGWWLVGYDIASSGV